MAVAKRSGLVLAGHGDKYKCFKVADLSGFAVGMFCSDFWRDARTRLISGTRAVGFLEFYTVLNWKR